MPAKKRATGDPNMLAVYEKIIASNPKAERKGDTIPHTSLNGNMFSLLGKDGSLGFRISKEGRENFIKKYSSAILTQYLVVMKQYVRIPGCLLSNAGGTKKIF